MLSYTVSGTGDAVAVLLHELGGNQHSWDAVTGQVEHEFQVLRYDQRGQGQSEKVRAPFTLDEHVDDLESLMESSGLVPPYLLVGAAAGCAVAVAYAARWPARVAALLLCAPALGTDASRKTYLAQRSQKAVSQGMRAVVDGALANSYPAALRGDGAQFDAYRTQLLTCDPVGYAYANQALADADLTADLGRVKCHCVLLAGRHDPLRPAAYVRDMAAALAHAQVVEVESGHLMPIQAPATIATHMLALKKNVLVG
jgi:3-oxoadipate enol-lactonase